MNPQHNDTEDEDYAEQIDEDEQDSEQESEIKPYFANYESMHDSIAVLKNQNVTIACSTNGAYFNYNYTEWYGETALEQNSLTVTASESVSILSRNSYNVAQRVEFDNSPHPRAGLHSLGCQ